MAAVQQENPSVLHEGVDALHIQGLLEWFLLSFGIVRVCSILPPLFGLLLLNITQGIRVHEANHTQLKDLRWQVLRMILATASQNTQYRAIQLQQWFDPVEDNFMVLLSRYYIILCSASKYVAMIWKQFSLQDKLCIVGKPLKIQFICDTLQGNLVEYGNILYM